MRAAWSMFILFGGILSGVSQGTVNFANTGAFATTADRFVYIGVPGGTKLTGTNYVAALYFGTTADSINQFAVRAEGDESLSRAVAPFRAVDPTSSAAGTWAGGTRYLLGTTVGQMLLLQVRVWDITKGATPEEAVSHGSPFMQSCPFDYTVPSPTDAVGQKMENFHGLPDFRCVPEPSTLATIALGIAAFLLFRARAAR